MAERVAKFPEGVSESRKRKYPWEEWTDGSIWVITRGVDFKVGIDVMRMTLYNRARLAGTKVEVRRVSESILAFQYFDEED